MPKIWEQLPPEVLAYILILEEARRQSLEKITRLEQRVIELEERLNRNSSNSSQPPSQDSPQIPKKTKTEKSGRSPGGQPGHQGSHRELAPPEQVNKIVEHRAETCPHCRSALQPAATRPASPVEVKPDLPAEVGKSACGPRLQAWVAIRTGRFRQSRQQVVELLRELCGVRVSLGSIQSPCEETSEALAVPYREAKEAVVAPADMAHLDETGWQEKGKRHWLWVAVTRLATVFLVACSRGRQALRELSGEQFQGIVHSDRWSAYTFDLEGLLAIFYCMSIRN